MMFNPFKKKIDQHQVIYIYTSGTIRVRYEGTDDQRARNTYGKGKGQDNVLFVQWLRNGKLVPELKEEQDEPCAIPSTVSAASDRPCSILPQRLPSLSDRTTHHGLLFRMLAMRTAGIPEDHAACSRAWTVLQMSAGAGTVRAAKSQRVGKIRSFPPHAKKRAKTRKGGQAC